jgi:hypothetical protein
MAVPTWIPVAVNLPGDEKSLVLDIKLGMERSWSYVVHLWCEAAKYNQNGRIEGPHADALVAKRAGWTLDPEKFVRALVEARWLDQTPDGYKIHDWEKHTGGHITRLEEEKEKVREWRAKKAAEKAAAKAAGTGTVPGGYSDVTGNVPVTSPDVTGSVPGKREMERERESTTLIRDLTRPITPLVAFLRDTYPDIRDPWKCEAAWTKAYPGVDLLAEAIRAKAWEVSSPKRAKKNHASFLNRWFSNATPAPKAHEAPPLPTLDGAWLASLAPEKRARAEERWTATVERLKRAAYPDALPRLLAAEAAAFADGFELTEDW